MIYNIEDLLLEKDLMSQDEWDRAAQMFADGKTPQKIASEVGATVVSGPVRPEAATMVTIPMDEYHNLLDKKLQLQSLTPDTSAPAAPADPVPVADPTQPQAPADATVAV